MLRQRQNYLIVHCGIFVLKIASFYATFHNALITAEDDASIYELAEHS